MAKRNDAVTRWWRGISLRAKVTGVTVAVLAIGLLATGIGTVPGLRAAFVGNVESSLQQLSASNVALSLFDIEMVDGVAVFEARDDVASPEYFVAVYDKEGMPVARAGGRGEAPPAFPDELTPDKAYRDEWQRFQLPSTDGTGPGFQATAGVLPLPGTPDLHTQIVATSLAPVEQSIRTFLGIFSIVALITIVAGAFITRGLVTLTFRRLTQVETTAMAIASGDFSQRLTDIETGTEVGRLKTAINTMLGRVDAAISQRDATVRQMRRFIGDASHELRTPLVTVRGYAELYRMGAISGDENVAQAMERIEKEAIRMGVLVEDLLALARLDERREVAFVAVDLRPLARDAALDVRATSPGRPVTVIDTTAPEPPEPEPEPESTSEEPPTSPRKRGAVPTTAIALAGATLSMLRRRPRAAEGGETPPGDQADGSELSAAGLEPIVLGDENRIRQIVANLLGNARRFTAEDSPIEIEVGVDPVARMGTIAVVDHGEGVPEQIREQIFQRFWRADTSRARETGGSGLGLAIVASIVEALHGEIVVVETPGGGATFRVSLPLAEPTDVAEQAFIATQPLQRLPEEDAP